MTDQPTTGSELRRQLDDAIKSLGAARTELAQLRRRLRLAHKVRRAREHQLDGIRRALCDIGVMQDDDPYSHADLEDVIRRAGRLDELSAAVAADLDAEADRAAADQPDPPIGCLMPRPDPSTEAGQVAQAVHALQTTVNRVREAAATDEPAWRAEGHAGHGSPCGRTPNGSCAGPQPDLPPGFGTIAPCPAPRPGPVPASLHEQLSALLDRILTDWPSHNRADEHEAVRSELLEAVLGVVLPEVRIVADRARDSEATVQRVIELYERWVKAGPPPLGASMARWLDARLIELHHAILPPADEPKDPS